MIKGFVVIATMISSFANIAYAQVASAPAAVAPTTSAPAANVAVTKAEETKPRITFTDSSFSLRGRNQHDNNDQLTRNQLQYNVDLKVQLRLDKDGKWRVISRTKTGATFESGWNDLGVGNNSGFADDLNVRQIYLQYENAGTTASVGFLPVVPNSATKGILSYDEDGWVDGARLETTRLGKWAKRVTVTVGRIDDLSNPEALSRGLDTPNVIQVHVQGSLNKRISYVVEGTQFDSETAGSEQYLRAILDIATKDVISFIDKIVIEPLLQNTSQPVQGFALGAQTALSSTWSLTTQYSYKGHELSSNEKRYAPREDFYREGHQMTLSLTKKFTSIPVEWSLAAGKTVSGPSKTGDNLGLLNSRGLRVDTRLKVKF